MDVKHVQITSFPLVWPQHKKYGSIISLLTFSLKEYRHCIKKKNTISIVTKVDFSDSYVRLQTGKFQFISMSSFPIPSSHMGGMKKLIHILLVLMKQPTDFH